MALALNYNRAKRSGSNPIIRHGWTKPPEDYVKLNVDASFDSNTGLRWYRSYYSRPPQIFYFMCGRWDPQFVEDAATAEACALRNGLLLAGEVGCNKLVVESDCIEVVEVMQYGGNSLGAAATIYEDSTFLCRNFARVSFPHCSREANMAAHDLAKFHEVNQAVWHGEPPPCIRAAIANDVTIVDA